MDEIAEQADRIIHDAIAGHQGSQAREVDTNLALGLIAKILNEIAGPYCGHGERMNFCPYCKAVPTSFG